MAGKLIVDTIDTDNSFITLNVQQSIIATMNVSGIYSNTGIKMVGADGSVGGVSNTAITGNIISSQITSVANTQITGNIISSQISPNLTLNGNTTVTSYVEAVVAIGTVTTASTISLANGTVQTATLTASTACTFTMPTATAGKSFVLLLKQAASTGNGTATFTGVKFGTAGAPTITATAGKMDILTFIADGTNWYGSISQGYTP